MVVVYEVFVSKSGAETKVKTPLSETAISDPDTEKVIESPSTSVASTVPIAN